MTKLREIRKKKRLFLREVASSVGVSIQTVQRMEVYGVRKISTAKRYAKPLGVSWKNIIEE